MHTTPYTVADFAGQTIDNGRIRLVEAIGEGAHGVVYRAVEESSPRSSSSPSAPKEYAVKVLLKAEETSNEGRYQAREIVTHKIASDHPNVLTLHQVIEDNWFVYLVTDYCPGGDLFQNLIEQFKYCRNDELVKKIFIQILDAVQSIHDKGIYHRDLKPDNIFVNADGTEIYLGDFGLATDEKKSNAFVCGSSVYMSPECIGVEFNFKPYSPKKADIWSLGIILINMIVGRHPWQYATTDDESFLQYLANNDFLRTVLPISEGANEIIKQILTFNPYRRISIAEIRKAVMELDTFFMPEEEIANSNDLVRGAAAYYTPRAPTKGSAEVERENKTSGEGYPDILPEDVYLFVSPDPDVDPSPPALLSANQVFTIGSASSTSSNSTSSGDESAGPLTPEAHAVNDDTLLALPESFGEGGLDLSISAALPQKGPTSIQCLVQGIEEIMVI